MKDFDIKRKERLEKRLLEDRSFVFGGETFVYRPTVSYMVLEAVSEMGGTGNLVQDLEQAIISFLEPDQGDRFLAVCHNNDDPITIEDINDLCIWLTEVQTGRPTLAPSPSTGGREPTETDSTESSSIEPAVASAA